MIIYEVNFVWHVKVSGGYRNNDKISTEVRKYQQKPEPIARWKDVTENGYGYGVSYFTTFRAGEETFTIQSYTWHPGPGYCWEESWEDFTYEPMDPPKLGEAFEWTGDGWEPIPHPMKVIEE